MAKLQQISCSIWSKGIIRLCSGNWWTLLVVNFNLQPPKWLLLPKFARFCTGKGARARDASACLWLLVPGKSSLRLPRHFSFSGAANTTAKNCLQTQQSRAQCNGPPTHFELRLRVNSSSHIDQPYIILCPLSPKEDPTAGTRVFLFKQNR